MRLEYLLDILKLLPQFYDLWDIPIGLKMAT